MNDYLSQLAKKHGTDRHPESKHSYTPYYYNLFKETREEIQKVLEIGVGEGPGLRMWRDFFPSALIYGIDNEAKRVIIEERIRVYYGDQSSKESLEGIIKVIGADIDFVVEDGSHKPEDQIFTCKTLMPMLKSDVIYIIEDVADLCIVSSLTEYSLEIPLLKPRKKRYDDHLIVVRQENR